ncbi:hypothetical protein DSL72_009057 [Monilinia vaccinii-corymbosi]|uniref:Major facilitator superfamily (MFS) profile domain-containing protein n=1 Tax=Monilinia vaccinii-corymbosi TaxID=61207 RepID=A0A8A3PQ00_9HELO|nr:hypothetical protein DSL72_009057 [Monilinia vaccinii-corymbosi]
MAGKTPKYKLRQPDRSGPDPTVETLLDIAEKRNLSEAQRRRQAELDEENKEILVGRLGESILWTISLAMLHLTLDVLVTHQYAEEIVWKSIISRTIQASPVIWLLFYAFHPHPEPSHLFPRLPAKAQPYIHEISFSAASIIAGCYLIHITNEYGNFAIMKQAPPIGCIWIWSTSQAIEYVVTEEHRANTKALVWKQDLRIVPLCAGIYLLCYLDRSNIGNAKTLNSSTHDDLLSLTHMTAFQYIISLMVFLIAYAIFEVPSNYFLKKLSPSKWISFLMFSWGVTTIGLGFTHDFAGVAAVRFLLGMFEAGLFPGLVYYLTFWYRTSERSIRVAFILASATLAGAFGGAIAFGVGHMNGVHGMSAWRWLFVIEGIPSCLSSICLFFVLPDFPETVKWLSQDEKNLTISRLAIEGSKSHDKSLTWKEAKDTLCTWRLYAHYAVYFGLSTPFSSLSLFTPSITAGLGYTDLEAQLMTVPPYAVACTFATPL